MTGWIISGVGTIALAVAGHFSQAFFARYVHKIRKARSLARLQEEPLYRPGHIIASAIEPESGAEVVAEYYIADIAFGRVVLKSLDNARIIPMTCMEFEKLHVILYANKTYRLEAEK